MYVYYIFRSQKLISVGLIYRAWSKTKIQQKRSKTEAVSVKENIGIV